MAILFRPFDCLALRLERGQHMVGVVFYDVVVGMIAFGAIFWTRF